MNENNFPFFFSFGFASVQSICIVYGSSFISIIDHIVDANFVIVAYKHAMFNRLPILAFILER